METFLVLLSSTLEFLLVGEDLFNLGQKIIKIKDNHCTKAIELSMARPSESSIKK